VSGSDADASITVTAKRKYAPADSLVLDCTDATMNFVGVDALNK
jgi:hypothetical protein